MRNQNTFTDPFQNKDECTARFMYSKSLSWGAIVGGALVAIGLSFLLNMLMVAIGLSSFTVDKDGLTTLAISGYIVMLIGIIIVMFLAGMVAGHSSKAYSCNGTLHGFISWCLSLLVTIIFASAITNFMTNNLYALASGTNNVVTSAMSTEAGSNTANNLVQKAVENTDATKNQTDNTADKTEGKAQDNSAHEDTQSSNTDARSIADKAENIATTSAHMAGGTMIALFILFLIAALASMLGGYAGGHCNKKYATND